MMWVSLWILISVLTLMAFILLIDASIGEWFKRHPGVKPPRQDPKVAMYSIALLLLVIVCPFVNLLMVFTIIGNFDEMVNVVIKEIENRFFK